VWRESAYTKLEVATMANKSIACATCGGKGPHTGAGHPYVPEQPRTRLVGHVRAGDCVGPASAVADLSLEDVATGERVPLGWTSVGTDHD
jgi:hypothetical protein